MATDIYSRRLKSLKTDYEEFRQDNDFLRARKETAVLRTTLLKFLEGLEQRSVESYEAFLLSVFDSVKSRMMLEMQCNEDQADQWASWLISSIPLAFQASFGAMTHIGVKELKAVSSACKDIAKMLQVEKELETETTLTVDVDMADILHVFRHGVLPLLPMEMRKLVIQNMANILQERFSGVDLEVEFGEEPVYAEYEIVDECPKSETKITLPALYSGEVEESTPTRV